MYFDSQPDDPFGQDRSGFGREILFGSPVGFGFGIRQSVADHRAVCGGGAEKLPEPVVSAALSVPARPYSLWSVPVYEPKTCTVGT